jgi:hypothetical protein
MAGRREKVGEAIGALPPACFGSVRGCGGEVRRVARERRAEGLGDDKIGMIRGTNKSGISDLFPFTGVCQNLRTGTRPPARRVHEKNIQIYMQMVKHNI